MQVSRSDLLRDCEACGGKGVTRPEPIVILRPDIAIVGANNQRKEIFDCAGRLMRALGDPALVIPTRWDAYGVAANRRQALATAREFASEVTAASPHTRVVIPEYFDPLIVP